MLNNIKISPSIICADFGCLRDEIKELENEEIDQFHFDINDGNFTPIITIGPIVISSLRKITKMPFEAHLQIHRPEKQIDNFIDAGANIIIIHIEGNIDLFRKIKVIKDKGIKVGVALNPITPLSYLDYIIKFVDVVLIMTVDAGLTGQEFNYQMLSKIKQVKKIIDDFKLSCEIEVDGGINKKTIPEVLKAGANILTIGSGLFNVKESKSVVIKEIRELVKMVKNDV